MNLIVRRFDIFAEFECLITATVSINNWINMSAVIKTELKHPWAGFYNKDLFV